MSESPTTSTHTRLPTFVTEILFPLAERLINGLMLGAIPVLPVSVALLVRSVLHQDWLPGLGSLLLMIGCLVFLYARFVSPQQLRVTRLKLQNLPFRMVYFSDLHVNSRKGAAWMERVVALINAHSPDVILIGGDFYGHPGVLELSVLLAPLAALRAPLGVFAVFGNHDHGLHDHDRHDRPAELRALLPTLGIHLLNNESVLVAKPGAQAGVWLVAIGELWAEDDDIDLAFAGATTPDITVVLAHNPDLMDKISQHADLFLFGHTHAGQIYLPFAPGLGVPIRGKLYRGEFDLPQGRVFVGSGCGEASLAARFGTWPEIVVVDS